MTEREVARFAGRLRADAPGRGRPVEARGRFVVTEAFRAHLAASLPELLAAAPVGAVADLLQGDRYMLVFPGPPPPGAAATVDGDRAAIVLDDHPARYGRDAASVWPGLAPLWRSAAGDFEATGRVAYMIELSPVDGGPPVTVDIGVLTGRDGGYTAVPAAGPDAA